MADSKAHQSTTKTPDSRQVRSPQRRKSQDAPNLLECQSSASVVLQRLALAPDSLTPADAIALEHQIGNQVTLPFVKAAQQHQQAQLASNPTIPASQSPVQRRSQFHGLSHELRQEFEQQRHPDPQTELAHTTASAPRPQPMRDHNRFIAPQFQGQPLAADRQPATVPVRQLYRQPPLFHGLSHEWKQELGLSSHSPDPQATLQSSHSQATEPTAPIQKSSTTIASDNGIDDRIEGQTQPNNTGLPDRLKAGIEGLSGLVMDDVSVHYNSPKPAQLQALAYTQGSDIYVGPGQTRHLPHEAWHVVQQKQGRVKPTLQAKGIPINDDRELEREADVMGAKALQRYRPNPVTPSPIAQATNLEPSARSQTVSSVITREIVEDSEEKMHISTQSQQQLGNPGQQAKKVLQLQNKVNLRVEDLDEPNATDPVRNLEPEEFAQKEDNFLNKTIGEDMRELIESCEKEELKIGLKIHHIELKLIDSEIEVGVASEWEDIKNIINTLLKAEEEPNSEIAGTKKTIEAIYKPVKKAKSLMVKLEKNYRKQQQQLHYVPLGLSRKDAKMLPSYKKQKKKTLAARGEFSYALIYLIRVSRDAIQSAWERFGDFLPANLIPAAAVFRDRDFKGDLNKYTYHTGKENDPIWIVWYKSPNDYPPIMYQGKQYEYTDNVEIGNQKFGVSDENNPAKANSFRLRKVAHNESRQGQKAFNTLFNDRKVNVGGTQAPALGDKGGYDGDHVKDLGFGGKDEAKNYWPLSAEVNRRAFYGYNSRYIVNYIDPERKKGHARAIGGLIGKYFIVKGYCDKAVPDESGTAIAGTDAKV